MSAYTGLLLLGIAVSLDGLGVGVSYGIRNTRVPFIAICIIMLCSGCTVLLTMLMGDYLRLLIPTALTEIVGGLILILLGIFSFINIFFSKPKELQVEKDATIFSDIRVVLRSPAHADLDQSGIISKHEAALLGIALALDAFGAGIAASLLNYSAILTALTVAIMSGAFLFIGLKLGLYLSEKYTVKTFTYLPPILLIIIGLLAIM